MSESDTINDFRANVIKYKSIASLSMRAYCFLLLFGEFVMLLTQSIIYV